MGTFPNSFENKHTRPLMYESLTSSLPAVKGPLPHSQRPELQAPTRYLAKL
jgi:hypothetical protein